MRLLTLALVIMISISAVMNITLMLRLEAVNSSLEFFRQYHTFPCVYWQVTGIPDGHGGVQPFLQLFLEPSANATMRGPLHWNDNTTIDRVIEVTCQLLNIGRQT